LTEENYIVAPMEALMSGVMTIFFYALVIAAVWKIFQVASELGEIKAILSDIRRNTGAPAVKPAEAAPQIASPPVLPGPMSLESAEALLREIGSEEPKTTA
jgi:hypothetical protein